MSASIQSSASPRSLQSDPSPVTSSHSPAESVRSDSSLKSCFQDRHKISVSVPTSKHVSWDPKLSGDENDDHPKSTTDTLVPFQDVTGHVPPDGLKTPQSKAGSMSQEPHLTGSPQSLGTSSTSETNPETNTIYVPGQGNIDPTQFDIQSVEDNGDNTYTITDMTGRSYSYPPLPPPSESSCAVS